ncbi:MAG: GNAT family N-acetyltransferase [Bacteroidota bacterium]
MFSKKNQTGPHQLSKTGARKALSRENHTVYFFNSIKEVPADWDTIAPKNNLFLQKNYLQLLEEHPPKEMRFGYLLFYWQDQPIGLAIGQVQFFKADRSLNKEQQKTPGFFNTFARHLKEMVASRVEFITLVCGNLLLTGEHGFHFSETVDKVEAMNLLEEGLNFAQAEFEKQDIRASAILTKDAYHESRPQIRQLLERSFNEFTVQPSMIMDMCWSSFDDYAASLSSKYRVRMKRAFKKAKCIEKRALSLTEIEANLPRLYDLYTEIAANSGFNLINLNEHYLVAFKRAFPERFQLYAYYLEGKLIAYYTTIHNGDEMEAHFLGYDHQYNHQHQVYLNILYDLTRNGIDLGVNRVVFARTALEIKSSIGAKPYEMYCYFRHRSHFSNKFVRPILDYLRPPEEWKERHPFKD